MIHQIKNAVYRHNREYAELTMKDVAEATGKTRQTVRRWEAGDDFPSADAEAILIEKANLTRLDFVEIICKVLSKFLGRPVIIAAQGQYAPASPLEGAAELLSTHRDKLAPEVQRRLEDSLRAARKQAAETDRASIALEQEIRGLIVNALDELGETLSETEIN